MNKLTLADLCELVVDCKNRTPPEAAPGEQAVGFAIGTPNIVNGRIRLSEAKPVSQGTFDIWTARATPREGDIILTREAPVGRVGRIEEGMNVCLGQRTMLLRPSKQYSDSRFLHYFLLSPTLQDLLQSQASGSTVAHLRLGQVRELKIPPVPEVEAQRRIGAVLGALDDKIAINERISAAAMELGRVKFQLLSNSAHEKVTVGDVVELKYGKSLPATRRIAGLIPVFGSGGISGSHNEFLVKGPGIAVGRKGTVGTVYWSEVDFFPIDTTFYIACKSNKVSLEYMYFALRGLGLEYMNSDSAVPGLNRERAQSLLLRIPASEAMQEFTVEARNLFRLQRSREEENLTLATLRDALLPQLMFGRLRVKDAEKIVEDHA
ncbi:restriction endonuclease subunit S [Streptomyces sp. NPDC102279]|uniref:restriction endonuclease subunit S n=1 Tax=Streptomyces sp. NPDC102279 TaxID=3366153 RepID=UPI0037F1E032